MTITENSSLSAEANQCGWNPARDYRSANLTLRACCWLVALVLGAVQAWATRFTMNPDGISYLDVGDAYWRGDWHNATNAYWSPLYSWILGGFLKLLRPSPYWEYPLAHLVNFLIYVAALACFEFFLITFIEERERTNEELQSAGFTSLTTWCWWILGYCLFISSSLILVGLAPVTPDIAVSAFLYLASGLLLRIYRGSRVTTYIALGCVLGLSYLTKAVMFPLAFVFLAVAAFARGHNRSTRRTAIAASAFVVVSAPFLLAISAKQHHLTFGESGSLNYSFYVNRVPYWPQSSPNLLYPMHLLSTTPRVYEFRNPSQGTFPPWYDPTYWHAGIEPHFTVAGEGQPMLLAAVISIFIFWVLHLNYTIGALLLCPSDLKSFGEVRRSLPIIIPALATFALYSLVHLETRFVAAQTVILFLSLYSAITIPHDEKSRRSADRVILTVASISALIIGYFLVNWCRTAPPPVYAEAAHALSESGIRAGDSIGLIWNEQWNSGAAEGAVVPRLLRLKIVAEVPEADAFWTLDAGTRNSAIAAIRSTGVRAILARRVPENARHGWKQLGNTEFFAYLFPTS